MRVFSHLTRFFSKKVNFSSWQHNFWRKCYTSPTRSLDQFFCMGPVFMNWMDPFIGPCTQPTLRKNRVRQILYQISDENHTHLGIYLNSKNTRFGTVFTPHLGVRPAKNPIGIPNDFFWAQKVKKCIYHTKRNRPAAI
jgi:hypothetical protein